MLVVHATFPIDSEHQEEARERIKTLAEHSRQEDGIIEYQTATDIDDENLFRFFEQYENEAAFEAHAETNHFQDFEAALPELLAGEPTVRQFEVTNASSVEL